MKRASLVILLGCLSATAALATTYVRVEKDGSKTYSDRPLPGGQVVDIQPAQSYSAPPSAPSQNSSRSPEEQQLFDATSFRYACALSPRNDETFQNPESIIVALQLTPSLRPGDEVKLTLDGTSLSNDTSSVSQTVATPERGTHTANAQVTDRSGRPLCNTSTTFHVQRSGVNSPTRRPAPTPPRPRPPRPTPH